MSSENYIATTAAQNSAVSKRGRRPKRLTAPIVAKLFAVLAVAGAALAPALFALPTATVNSTRDLPDANVGDGVCDTEAITGQIECTLRAAIEEANFDPAATAISFAIPPTDSNHLGGILSLIHI